MKSSKFAVNFMFKDLNLSQQDEIYNFLIHTMPEKFKDKFHVCIVDEIGGEHYLTDGLGKRPSGVICDYCSEIDCGTCYKWKVENGEK